MGEFFAQRLVYVCYLTLRGWGVWGLPRFRDEDHLCDFPLSWKVTVEQQSIEELFFWHQRDVDRR
jgi:hypothetical protein